MEPLPIAPSQPYIVKKAAVSHDHEKKGGEIGNEFHFFRLNDEVEEYQNNEEYHYYG